MRHSRSPPSLSLPHRGGGNPVALTFVRAARRPRLAPKRVRTQASHSVTSIFTAAVIFFHVAISPASQDLASSTDFDGTMLKFCLVSASFAAGACSASTVALYKASSTGLGVPAGTHIAVAPLAASDAAPTFPLRRSC